MTTAAELASYASSFPSFRNRIINGNLSNPINQRGAASITASTGYTYDRWYYDGSTYLYQGIEDKNVNNGTYVISWEGAGINAAWKVSTDTTAGNGPDATTGFTSVSNGGTFTVNEGTEYSKHLWIRFDGTLANLNKVQVEEGTVATPFEHRPYGTELALCQRYYQYIDDGGTWLTGVANGAVSTASSIFNVRIPLYVPLRSSPTLNSINGTQIDADTYVPVTNITPSVNGNSTTNNLSLNFTGLNASLLDNRIAHFQPTTNLTFNAEL
jgi:hypothetical protein